MFNSKVKKQTGPGVTININSFCSSENNFVSVDLY